MKDDTIWNPILEIAKNTPSGANMQPWSVLLIDEKNIAVIIDPKIADKMRSYEYLAAFVSLGSLSYNIKTVAEALGYEVSSTCDDYGKKGLGVKITLGDYNESRLNPQMIELVKKRCTNRKPNKRKIPAEIIEKLEQDFNEFIKNNDSEELVLQSTRDPVLMEKVADILAKSEELRIDNPPTKQDLFNELKCQEADSPKKIALKTLEFPWLIEKMMCLMIKAPFTQCLFSAKVFRAMIKKHLIQSSDLACIFGPKEPSPKQLIQVGSVLQHMWLKNTSYGYAFQPWASFPYFNLEKTIKRPYTFSDPERKTIETLIQKFSLLFDENERVPLFVFRLHDSPQPIHRSSKRKIEYTTL